MNRCYYTFKGLLVFKLLKRKTKLTLYKTLIRSVTVYGAEYWKMNSSDKRILLAFERKIIKKIYGLVRETDGTYRIRCN